MTCGEIIKELKTLVKIEGRGRLSTPYLLMQNLAFRCISHYQKTSQK